MSQEKHCSITDLPEELRPIILYGLDKISQTSLSNITISNRMFGFGAFQNERIKLRLIQYLVQGQLDMIESLLKIRPDFASKIPDVYEQALFLLASSAEQNKMEPLLKKHPELLLKYGPLQDISGAYFKSITLFQHAVWAGDVRYMCEMMLNCLPKNKQGEEIRLDLVRQFNELMNHGVVYVLDSKEHKEQQFSLQPLIEALRTYVASYDNWDDKERKHHWCTVVGTSQNHLPAHVRHHYCDPNESFNPTPTFTKNTLVRSLKLFNHIIFDNYLWAGSLQSIGLKFGICRVNGPNASSCLGVAAWIAARDLLAIEALCKVRTQTDLPNLKRLLERPILRLDENPDSMAMTF